MRRLLFSALLTALSVQTSHASNCASQANDLMLYEQSQDQGLYRYAVDSGPAVLQVNRQLAFSDYLSLTKKLIEQRNPKAYLPCPLSTTVTQQQGLVRPSVADLVAPFELTQPNNDKAVLLIHGLTDSPFTFHALAGALFKAGYNVRTMLLPGHSTAASDLKEVNYRDWQQHVRYAIDMTSKDYKHFAVLGYSTGAAVSITELNKHTPDNLKSLALISPATEPHNKHGWLAKWIDLIPFMNWIDRDADLDFAKYESFPWHAAALANQAMSPLEGLSLNFNLPVFSAFSDVDTTIDNSATIKLLDSWYQQGLTKQQVLLYSNSVEKPAFTSDIPVFQRKTKDELILDMSHIGILQPSEHSYYGVHGHYRNCTSYLEDKTLLQQCKLASSLVQGERTEENMANHQPMARLTFNPDFTFFEASLISFLDRYMTSP